MANEDYVDVEFDIFEYTGQRARVRKTLTIEVLINEILREFDDIPSDSTNKYVLYLKGVEKPLDQEKTIAELDIQPQDELVFDRHRTFLRRMLPPDVNVYFVEEKSAEVFEVQWQPAIIGRTSTDMDHNFSLAVNLQYLPDAKTISRRHAQLTFSDNRFWIEPQAENNPVFLNGREMPFQKKFEIKDGDKIMLGFNRVKLTFKHRKLSAKQQQPSTVVDEPEKKTAVEELPVESATQILDFSSQIGGAPSIPQLVIETASDTGIIGQSILLENLPLVLGRNHPLLGGEKDISRQHIEIIQDPRVQKYYIRDLNSTNGVKLDGYTIPPNVAHEIIPGSHIQLGKIVTMLFRA